LPDPIAEPALSVAEEGPEAFGRERFVDRVATKAGVDEVAAGDYPGAVGGALARAVSGNELDDIRSGLPDDLSEALRAPRSEDAPQ
jgi:uncharacterized protein (DUF2267 family)